MGVVRMTLKGPFYFGERDAEGTMCGGVTHNLITHLNGGIISRMGSWEEESAHFQKVFQRQVRRKRWRGQGREDRDNVGKPGCRKGCPYKSSKGSKLRVFFGRAQSLSRAKGRSLTQSWWISRPSLVRVCFRVQLVYLTLPEYCG
jgi:hypothetical protein